MALRDEGVHWLGRRVGPVRHVECTTANVADVIPMHTRLHGDEGTACGDSSHTGLGKREDMVKCRARCLIAAR